MKVCLAKESIIEVAYWVLGKCGCLVEFAEKRKF